MSGGSAHSVRSVCVDRLSFLIVSRGQCQSKRRAPFVSRFLSERSVRCEDVVAEMRRISAIIPLCRLILQIKSTFECVCQFAFPVIGIHAVARRRFIPSAMIGAFW